MQNNRILELIENGESDFLFFWGHTTDSHMPNNKCLSQWSPHGFKSASVTNPNIQLYYKTAEHYMMAEKAKLFDDIDIAVDIVMCGEPKEAKALGRKVKNFDEYEWNKHKYRTVVDANYLKFMQNESICLYLLSTGNQVLVEASPSDTLWGIGMDSNDPDVNDPSKWKGENLLGFALMDVRERIRRERDLAEAEYLAIQRVKLIKNYKEYGKGDIIEIDGYCNYIVDDYDEDDNGNLHITDSRGRLFASIPPSHFETYIMKSRNENNTKADNPELKLNRYDKKILVELLNMASDTFSNHGCNDIDDDILEAYKKSSVFDEYDEDDECDPGDWSLMSRYASLIANSKD